jgi:chaperonin GroEL
MESKIYGFGYDAQTGEFGDLMKLGIIDPTKVVRTALQDAASIAGLIVTTEATITEHPKKDSPAMPGGGGMGGNKLSNRDLTRAYKKGGRVKKFNTS